MEEKLLLDGMIDYKINELLIYREDKEYKTDFEIRLIL
jgi:hypothetical protein